MAVNILIVEDDESVGATLCPILEDEGYHCELAATAQEALAKIEATSFDVLLVDARLGAADGLSVLKHFSDATPQAVGIVLTGYGSMEAAIAAMHAGADDFLIKPVDIEELKASIVRNLDWRARLVGQRPELARVKQQLLEEIAGRRAQEELNRLKDEILAIASHDLKGPLTTIRGYAQVLQRRAQSPSLDLEQLAKGLGAIDAQAAAVASLLDALLDATRIQAGALGLRIAPCDIGDCLESVLARLSPQERERVDVRRQHEPLVGKWDQRRIEQAFANLVGNALKYSPEPRRIMMTMKRVGREIQVAVRDRGVGVPPEELPRLFERFYRTPQAQASGLSGVGLGLYICRGVIETHGGRIWAESSGEGRGTTFRFSLPIEPPDNEDSTRREE